MTFGSGSAGRFLFWSATVTLAALAAVVATVMVRTASPDRRLGSTASGVVPSGGPSAAVTLIVSGDTAGWIVPCGCTSNQSGGLLRRSTYVAGQRKTGPVILADAGGAPGGTSAYHRLKFEAILRGELLMSIAAHNLGGPEAALGADELRRIERELRVPFVSANLRDSHGKLITTPCRIVEAGGQRIALVGVVTSRETYADCRVDDPRDAVLATLRESKGTYELAVVLAWVPEAELRTLAAALPEVHAVIGGPTGQSLAPQKAGPTLIGSATNKGKFLARVTIPAAVHGGDWTGTAVELTKLFDDDPQQVQNVDTFRQQLAVRDFAAGSTGLVPPQPAELPAGFRVAGSAACAACHAEEHRLWADTRHGHAWATLITEKSQVDPECQRCHTTGYGLPGGFTTMAASTDRVDVGCESCHGPSQAHVERPKRRTPWAASSVCRQCHDRENSPQFEFDQCWPRIVHGKDASSNAISPADR